MQYVSELAILAMLRLLLGCIIGLSAGYDWYTPITLEEYRSWLACNNVRLLVIEYEGRVIGVLEYRCYRALDGKETMYVEGLAVDPDYQGRGVATRLLEEALTSRLCSVERVYLDAVAGLEKFYARLGFREHGKYVVLSTPLDALPNTTPTLEFNTLS